MHKLMSYSFILCTLFLLLPFKNVFAQKPTISSFSPIKGNVGSTVIISGINFSTTATNNFVLFGDVRANVLTATTTSITVTVPAGASYKPISVTVNSLTAYSSIPFTVTFPGDGNDFNATSFAARMDSSWGFSANDIGATDLDGDGDADPVVVSRFSNLISVLKNNSAVGAISLSYSSLSNFATGTAPASISFGDLNGDNKQDIIVVNSQANSISVFKNNSTIDSIKLLPKIDVASGNSPSISTINDIDNDGKPDIVCTNSSSNNISIFRNTSGSGIISFAAKMDFSTGRNPYGLTVADIDGDGVAEIIVANEDDFSISIFRNTSSPGVISLGTRTDIAGVNPSLLKAADLDNDGKTDLIATTINSTIAVLKNTSTSGSFSFAAVQQIQTGFGNPSYISVGDIDGDGKPDLAVNHINYSTVSIVRNSSIPGTISFGARSDFFVAAMSLAILLTDLDSDARPDIISGNATASALSILKNIVPNPYVASFAPITGGNGTNVTITGNNFNTTSQVNFGGAPASSFTVQSSTTIIAAVDTGSTGEVIVTTAYGIAKSSGFNFSKAPTITSFTPTNGDAGTIVTINGTNLTNTTTVNFGSVPATSFSVVSPTRLTATVGSIAAGNCDVSVNNSFGTATLGSFYTGVTINSFYPTSGPAGTTVTINGTHFSANPSDNIVYFGSVRASVLSATQTSLLVSVPVGSSYQPITVTVNNLTAYSLEPFTVTFKGTGNEFTATSFGDRVDSTAGSAGVHVSVSDLNNDGKSDVIISNFASSSISVAKNTSSNGVTSFQRKVDYMLDNYALSSSVGDLDGDGKLDIVAIKEQSGVSLDRSISIFKNISTTDTILLTKTDYSLGSLNDNPKFSLITDLDGDGKPEIAVLTYSNIVILRNTSSPSSVSFAPKIDISFGQVLATSITTADVDGDGKTDIIITADNAEKIYIIRNISKPGQISFAQKVMIGTGFSPKSVSLADLNNDGKPDMIAFNRGNNSVSTYKNTSIAGVVSFDNRINYQLDLVPEIMALADLDGDARTDISFVNKGQFAYVMKNTSAGGNISFADKVEYDVPYLPSYVTNADMNNDGKTDIIVSNFSTANKFSVLVNKCQNDGFASAPVNVSGPLTFCEGENVVLKTSSINGGIYQWYKEGAALPSANDSVLIVDAAGIYSVRITIGGVPSVSAPYMVRVKPIPAAPQLTLTGTGNICQGTATFLHSSAPTGIKWYKDDILLDGVIDSVYRASAAGRYKIIANSNGCSSAFSNEVVITVNLVPSPTITASANTFCEGDSVILDANNVNGYTYQWNINGEQLPGAISPRLITRKGGNFSITESNSGCSAISQTITISRISPPPKPTITQIGQNLSSSALSGNQWFRDGAVITGATSQVYTPTNSGNYSVQVTQNGCKSIISELYTLVVTSVVFIDNTHFIRLSPNPVKDEMVLDFKLDGIYELNIDLLDLNGRLMKRWQNQNKGSRLSMSNYAKSVYIARVYSNRGEMIAVLKLIRQ